MAKAEKASSRLPKGWNRDLKTIDREIAKTERIENRLYAEKGKRIKIIEDSIRRRMPRRDSIALLGEKEVVWQKVRKQHKIEHPKRISAFRNYQQAAEVLAYYWQGKSLDHDELVEKIMRGGDTQLEAFDYAQNLTNPGSAEREYVDKAWNFLWKDYKSW